MTTTRQLPNFLADFIKSARDVLETETVRPYRVSDTARRLPGARTGVGQERQAYTAPAPAAPANIESSASARAVPPPPV